MSDSGARPRSTGNHARVRSGGAHFRRYVGRLPDQLASYPECRAKASLLRFGLEARPVAPSLVEAAIWLPPEIAEYLVAPPPFGSWLPETHYVAALCAIGDLHEMEERDFTRFIYELSRRILKHPVYAALFKTLTPEFVIRMTASLWSRFHRGWRVSSRETDAGLEIAMHFPPGMIDELHVHGYTQTWQALVHGSRYPRGQVELESFDLSTAQYRVIGYR